MIDIKVSAHPVSHRAIPLRCPVWEPSVFVQWAWTKTAEEQTTHDRKIGVAFYPSKDVLVAVAQAKTMWEGEELHVNETTKT